MRLSFTFLDCAESSAVVSFGPHYNKELSLAILDMSRRLESGGFPGVRESIPALSSLTVFYDPIELPRESLVAAIGELCESELAKAPSSLVWEIPVVYGGEGGPDLKDVAALAGVTEDELISLHTGPAYHVYMLGFLPGFAYLGDLPEPLRLPRRATPRARVPAGSVAIAADMTAVYPHESPGGWHLIGSTPLLLWDMARQKEPLLKPGDQVKFSPISEHGAAALRQKLAEGWQPQPAEVP